MIRVLALGGGGLKNCLSADRPLRDEGFPNPEDQAGLHDKRFLISCIIYFFPP